MKYNILVVEDEQISCLFLVCTLKSLGYAVAGTASTGEDAIQLADSSRPDLVIMDIGLKGDMNGAQAAEIITQRHRIPCLFISAYTRNELHRHYALPDSFHFLPKPVLGDQLHVMIDEILDSAG